jgi:hypothetical protein
MAMQKRRIKEVYRLEKLNGIYICIWPSESPQERVQYVVVTAIAV